MIAWLLKKIRLDLGKFELNGILYLFRYASFTVTSIFFLLNETSNFLEKKMFIVCCMGIASVLLNYLYTNHLDNAKIIISLLFIETVYNTFILIPSGGLNSPYIWYSLNTILIGSLVLNKNIYCWIDLSVYVFSSTWIMCTLLDSKEPFAAVLKRQSNLLLSLILITGAIQILVSYSRKIKDKNTVLGEANSKVLSANKKIKESMDSIMELYQAVHLLTNQSDQNSLLNIIIEYTMKITKSKNVFFIKSEDIDNPLVALSNLFDSEEEKKFKTKLPQLFKDISSMKAISRIKFEDKFWMVTPVNCHFKVFGAIGVELSQSQVDSEEMDMLDQLTFLSELGTMALERFELEEVNARLLINEEQNRIANEIHDGVLQKLFSISCGVYGLIKRSAALSPKKFESELTMIQSSINKAMSDLRSTIYGYSWKKEGNNNFILDIQSYIDSIRIYHGIDVNFELSGNHELLSTEHKKAFYRMITEGIGNAIRHGNARRIAVSITIGMKDVLLQIVDDGLGFDVSMLENINKAGMGVRNIQLLAQSLQGNVRLSSQIDKGTTLSVNVPIGDRSYKEEFVI